MVWRGESGWVDGAGMDMDKCMAINAFMRVCKWRVCRGGCVGKEVGVVCYRCECGGGVQILTAGFQIHHSS